MSTTWLDIRGAPALRGLRFRRFRGAEDFAPMAALVTAVAEADGVDHVPTVEEIAHSYAHLSNCDPYQDMIFAEVGAKVIAYNRVKWDQEAEGTYVYTHFGHLHPAWRRRGIGRAMLRAAEARLRHIAAGHPQDGPRTLQSWAADTEVGARALLEAEGYRAVRYEYEMVRPNLDDLPEAPLPPGLEVRPAVPEHDRAIWEAMQEAFRDHWGYRPRTETDYEEWRTWPHYDRSLWRVAWAGDQVAGMVLSFIDRPENEAFGRRRGYTEAISVRRPWRRRGLARALIVQSLRALRERGMTEAGLGVDAENRHGALRLYRSVGFQVTKESATYRKPMDVEADA